MHNSRTHLHSKTGPTTHTWNYRNLLIQSTAATSTLYNLYDQGDRRVYSATTTANPRYFFNNNYELWGNKKTKHLYANNQLIATVETVGSTASPYYQLTDPLQSATLSINASGTVVESTDYLPFGEARLDQKATAFNQDRKYIGQVYDESTSMSYLNARYYEGGRGQFLSEDPLLLGVPSGSNLLSPQSLNFYSYSVNNPMNRSDPSGLRAFTQAEIAYNQQTFAQIDQLYAMGKPSVALQMTFNLYAYIHEIEAITTGGNFVGGGSSGGGSTQIVSSGMSVSTPAVLFPGQSIGRAQSTYSSYAGGVMTSLNSPFQTVQSLPYMSPSGQVGAGVGLIGQGLGFVGGFVSGGGDIKAAGSAGELIESNGFRFSKKYWSELWDSGRAAPGYRAEAILNSTEKVIADPRGKAGFFNYYSSTAFSDPWYMTYNPTTGEVWHIGWGTFK